MNDHEQQHEKAYIVRRRKSRSVAPFGVVLLGILLIFLPFFLGALGGVKLVMVIFGTGLLVIGAIIVTITRLYIKGAPNEAFVRTGMGGPKVIVDGGTLVIPVIHELIFVSLETMRLDVDRSGPEALITGDKLRADLNAEFYIHVKKDMEGVAAAAKSLGDRSMSPDFIKKLVFEKLVSALRTVAATKTLQELHAERADFAREVQVIVTQDLATNGLFLESVTISGLDMTGISSDAAEENYFDAQGAYTLAKVIQENRVKTNEVKRDADKKVAEQDVDKQKFVFDQEQAEAEALAAKNAAVEKAKAQAKQEADTFRSQEEQKAELAEVEKEEAVSVRTQQRLQEEEVAERAKEQQVQVAEVKRDQAKEVAEREAQLAIAQAEQARAEAEALLAQAEKTREEAVQATLMVEETEEAKRSAEVKYITTKRHAEEERTRKVEAAEADAFEVERAAEARQTAAEAEAAAVRTEAKAAKDAKTLAAEGDRAVQMVPVEVDREAVTVEDARVEVQRKDLAMKDEHSQIAMELQIELAKIAAKRDARIAAAEAFGQALKEADMTIWGDPTTLANMHGAFLNGQRNGQFLTGVAASMPPGLTSFAERAVGGIGELAAAVIKKVVGIDVAPSEAESLLTQLLQQRGDATPATEVVPADEE